MPTDRTRQRQAFSLVETLVVISLIVLLVALLMPALAMARNVSRQSQCANNQRQIGLACAAYTTDDANEVVQPYRTNQHRTDRLELYLEYGQYPRPDYNRMMSIVWRCPDNMPDIFPDAQGGVAQYYISYRPSTHMVILNPLIAPATWTTDIMRMSKIGRPSEKVSFVEVLSDYNSIGATFRTPSTGFTAGSFNFGFFHLGRRNTNDQFIDGKMNILFVDGHVGVVDYEHPLLTATSIADPGYIRHWDPRQP